MSATPRASSCAPAGASSHTSGCCGGAAKQDVTACCIADEAAKAEGMAGCGCGCSKRATPHATPDDRPVERSGTAR